MIRNTTFLFLFLAAALSLALFSVTYRVQNLDGEITGLNRAITDDRKAIHVLRAEWSYLNDPDRLGERARRYLRLAPIGAEQISKIADIPKRKDLSRQTMFPAPMLAAPMPAAPVSMKKISGEGVR